MAILKVNLEVPTDAERNADNTANEKLIRRYLARYRKETQASKKHVW